MDFPSDADGETLKRLAEAGIDLSKPREIDFMIDVPTEDAGKKVSELTKAQGYAVELIFDEGGDEEDFEDEVFDEDDEDADDDALGPTWTVYATVTLVPTYEELVARQKALTELATPVGGTCEAWGTME